MRALKLAICFAVLATLVSMSLFAQQSSGSNARENTSASSLTVGYGYEYSGLGVAAEWYSQRFGALQTGVMAGVGYFPSITIGGVATDAAFGWGAGVRLALGRKSRLIGDLQYGFAGEAAEQIGGARQTAKMWGTTVAGGYQFIGPKGFEFLATVGETWFVNSPQWVTLLMGRSVVTLNVGLGYKTR